MLVSVFWWYKKIILISSTCNSCYNKENAELKSLSDAYSLPVGKTLGRGPVEDAACPVVPNRGRGESRVTGLSSSRPSLCNTSYFLVK